MNEKAEFPVPFWPEKRTQFRVVRVHPWLKKSLLPQLLLVLLGRDAGGAFEGDPKAVSVLVTAHFGDGIHFLAGIRQQFLRVRKSIVKGI
jgi:hypothetical protein